MSDVDGAADRDGGAFLEHARPDGLGTAMVGPPSGMSLSLPLSVERLVRNAHPAGTMFHLVHGVARRRRSLALLP